MNSEIMLTITQGNRRLQLVHGSRYMVKHVGKSTKKIRHNDRAGELRGLRQSKGTVMVGLLMDDNGKMGWFNANDIVAVRGVSNA